MIGRAVLRRRGDGGAALLEVLLVLALTAMMLGPLTAWWVLAMRQRPVIADQSVQVAQTAFLNSYLPKDIAVAGSAANDAAATADVAYTFEDCRGGSGAGGTVVVVLLRGGQDRLTKTAYTEVTAADSTTELWRRTCDSGTGNDTSAVRIMRDVEPGTSASCVDGPDGSACRQITVRVTPKGGDPVVVRGQRRVDAAVVAAQVGGARAPIAKISVVSQTSTRPYAVEFSAEQSSDPDGSIVCYQWVFTTNAEGRGDPDPVYITTEVPDPGRDPSLGPLCPDREAPGGEQVGNSGPSGDLRRQLRTLPTSGVYFVELVVTDDTGASATTYRRFEIEPRSPVPEARIAALTDGTASAGATVFEFAAQWTENGVTMGSRHPDGTIVEYRWTLDAPGLTGLRFERVQNTPTPWYSALPEEMAAGIDELGTNVGVTLTVTDDEGRTADYVTTLVLQRQDPSNFLPADQTWTLGAHPGPTNLRPAGAAGSAQAASLVWDPAPEVDRYVVQFDLGCGAAARVVVPASPAPTVPLLPSRCDPAGPVSVSVAAELGATLSPWSNTHVATVALHEVPRPDAVADAPVEAGG